MFGFYQHPMPPMFHTAQSLWFATFSYDWLICGGVAYDRYWLGRRNGNLFLLSDVLVKSVRTESAVMHPHVASNRVLQTKAEDRYQLRASRVLKI